VPLVSGRRWGSLLASSGWLLAAVAGCCLAATAALGCQVDLRATLPMSRAGTIFVVPVGLNGDTLDFELDTGSFRTILGRRAADRLDVVLDEWVTTRVHGIGGEEQFRLARPQTLSLGGMMMRRRTLAGDNTVLVGDIPENVSGRRVVGLLGEDYLSQFDLDLDPANGTLGLSDVKDCSGDFVPWRAQKTAVAAVRPFGNVLLVPVHVGGQAMLALLDTGSEVSTVLAPGMAKLGLDPGGSRRMRGVGPEIMMGRPADLSLQVGSLPAATTSLLLLPARISPLIDVLLGADWLGRHHVWISWATNQVFVEN